MLDMIDRTDCTATLAEIRACERAYLDQAVGAIEGFECSDLEDEAFWEDSFPAACQVVQEKCPQYFGGSTNQGGGECVEDEDCGSGMLCLADEGTCEFRCDTIDDCIGDEACVERDSDGAGYCLPGGGGGPQGCSSEPNPDGYCVEELEDSEAICQNNMCVIPNGGGTGDGYYVAYVHDVTTARCDDMTYETETDGSKLMHVALIDSAGTYRAYGVAVEWYYGTNDVWFGEVEDVLNGMAPNYDANMCPEPASQSGANGLTNFHEGAVVAIGCGGEVFVRFFDGSQPIEIEDGDVIEVNEYGPECSAVNSHTTQTGDDFYDVYVCEGPAVSLDQAWFLETELDTCVRLNSSPATGRTSHTVSL